MKIISHRGNINGPNKDTENTIGAIDRAISEGYDVEIDLWVVPLHNGTPQLYLGHDFPDVHISYMYLVKNKERLWVHAKNFDALTLLVSSIDGINYFWHEDDQYALTSSGNIWAYPAMAGNKNVITVMPEISTPYDLTPYYGVCTDYPEMFKVTGEVPFK